MIELREELLRLLGFSRPLNPKRKRKTTAENQQQETRATKLKQKKTMEEIERAGKQLEENMMDDYKNNRL